MFEAIARLSGFPCRAVVAAEDDPTAYLTVE
jgi:hypothetical protein